jgi:hypothetical protein
MAKTRRNRSRRGGQEPPAVPALPTEVAQPASHVPILGGKSRRRRGGQYGPAPATTNASNLLGDIGSGAKAALDKTKEGVSWALNKVFPGSVTPNPPVQPYALGGRRKRRGGYQGYTGFKSMPASINAKGGSRRKRRGGGDVVGFDDNWREYGILGGSRRRRRKH